MKNFYFILLLSVSLLSCSNVKSETISDADLFGPNVYIFSPTDDMTTIRTTINNIHDQMLHDEFSSKRYAFYFKPGDYTQAGLFNIAYYTHIGGLGKLPNDVRLSNVSTPAPLPNNNATCTFCVSLKNFTLLVLFMVILVIGFSGVYFRQVHLEVVIFNDELHINWDTEGIVGA